MNLREKVENLLLVAEALAGHCPSEKEEIRVDGQIRAYREVIALMNEEKMNTGLFDKNGTPINIGDRTRLILDDGEVREFDVCFKTVERTVKCHPDFYDDYAKVAITGIVFCWNGYDLFPCIENGVYDTSKMEVIR